MALKHSYFFRPTSRPSSPAPPPSTNGAPVVPTDTSNTAERAARPSTKLAFTGFRRPSPAPGLPNGTSTTLVQDGSYLEALSLKLSEAVSRALAQPTGPAGPQELLGGRRPLPAGRGSQLGALIVAELNAAAGNVNLRRAIFRSLQRPMSVLQTNLSSNLLPLISSTTFLSPATPSVQAPNPNPTQLHALSYATFAGELIESFNDMGVGLESDMRGDGLKGVREDLVSTVSRVVNPLANAIKSELLPLIAALEQPAVSAANSQTAHAKGIKVAAVQHSSIAQLTTLLPIHAKALARYSSTPTAQTLVASAVLPIIWRGLVAISHRPSPLVSPPPTPRTPTMALRKPRSLSSTTPPTTPPATRFALKLPPSRPPSPPGAHGPVKPSTPANDARTLHELLVAFPRPTAERETTRLAREAVDEAFDALKALVALLDAVHLHTLPTHDAEELEREIETVAADIPTLIALPVLLRAFVFDQVAEGGAVPTVTQMLGMKEEEYRSGCLLGFGRAEEYAPLVGQRVCDVLRGQCEQEGWESSRPTAVAVLEWLEGRLEDSEDEAEDEGTPVPRND